MSQSEELDHLLTSYLHVLDRYTQLREELAKTLADGYLSLARTRFHSSPAALHFGIGPASFEGRPRDARLRCRVTRQTASHQPSNGSARNAADIAADAASDGADKDSPSSLLSVEVEVLPTPPLPLKDNSSDDRNESLEKPDKAASSDEGRYAPNPLRLFGALPSPALRETQAAFEKAVREPAAELVGILAELGRLERLIEDKKARIKTI